MKLFSIAVDGPSGAGKSSISKTVAKRLKIFHLDTGALYRGLAYYFIQQGINLKGRTNFKEELKNCNLKLKYFNYQQNVYLNDCLVNDFIRTSEVANAASLISSKVEVREYILKIERQFVSENSVIMDGRDIGTVVLPNANLKIFLTASLEVRALRRFKELERKQPGISFQQVLDELKKRDFNDKSRSIAPLKMAKDAFVVDNTNVSLNESVEKIIFLVKKHIMGE